MPTFPLKTVFRDLQLGTDGDLLVDTDLHLVTDEVNSAATVQAIKIRLQRFAGEWFLDLDSGIPYWEQILGQRTDVAVKVAQIVFRSEMLKVWGVVSVLSLSITVDPSTRTMNVAFTVQIANGDTAADELALALAGGVVQ
jgi:hypothetical protein